MLPAVTVSSAAASNTVMLAAGYFSPLTGFHNYANAIEIARHMRTMEGLLWSIPCLNLVHDATGLSVGKPVALRDPNVAGEPVLAIQHIATVETLSTLQLQELAELIFGTLDKEHPGVSTFLNQGSILISGPVDVLNYSYFETDFPATFKTAVEIREEIERRGWQRVVAFQTRNPMHRAHEELCKLARAAVDADGILIHMLLGKLKSGDIPADVRDAAIRKMVELYFPDNTVIIAGYGFDMLYAGPREAIFTALCRKNMGCSHFDISRDHTGIADFYPLDASQRLFERIDNIGIEPIFFPLIACDRSDGTYKTEKSCAQPQTITGTESRQRLLKRERLPSWFMADEVQNPLLR